MAKQAAALAQNSLVILRLVFAVFEDEDCFDFTCLLLSEINFSSLSPQLKNVVTRGLWTDDASHIYTTIIEVYFYIGSVKLTRAIT